MANENYLMIPKATNIVENICLWDGNPNTWTPPENYLMLLQATTPAKIWGWDGTEWVLVDQLGIGGIGFTWDGAACVTNESKPTVVPTTIGTQTL